MKTSEYEQEIIVLGSGLGGLVAGALLAQNNHSVLLLKEREFKPSITMKGYHFVPFSNFSEKCLSPDLVKRISQALNLPFSIGAGKGADKSKERTVFQVILPEARIDVFTQHSLSQKEWKREFPKEVAQIEEFYHELDQIRHLIPSFLPFHPRSFIKKMISFDPYLKDSMDKRLSTFSRNFNKFIQLHLFSRGNFYSERFPISLAAHLLFDETNHLMTSFDLEKLECEILNRFVKSGGKIEEIDGVRKVNTEWRKGFTLFLEGDPRVFRSKFLIFNSALHRISSLQGRTGKRLSKWGKQTQPLYVVVPLFLGIHEKVVPVGMKDLLISILDLDKPYQDGNVLFLSLSPKGDETKAPEGRRALIVESLMDPKKWEQAPPHDYPKAVMEHLSHLFPFLEEQMEVADFQWAIESSPRWSYPHFVYEATSDFDWREGLVPLRISKNIFFVGKENFPYLGLEGEILEGFMAAQQILKKYS